MSSAFAKVAYASQREVNIAIAHVIGRARRRDRGSMHAYRCRTCGRWHIGISMFMPPRRDSEFAGSGPRTREPLEMSSEVATDPEAKPQVEVRPMRQPRDCAARPDSDRLVGKLP
jgi:hypothetical protein